MKRQIISISLVLLATISGVIFSFNPEAATALASNRYVALGDSVAAGLGAGTVGSTGEDTLCGRSSSAYALRVSSSLNMPVEQYACSGAKANEGLYDTQTVGNTKLDTQLNRAFASGTPDVITVTIGANDVRWTQFVKQCYLWDCGTKFDDVQMTAYMTHFRWEMYRALSIIQAKSGGSRAQMPKVYFTGYFKPFSTSAASCADTRNFTPGEMTWLNTQVDKLNQTIIDSVSWYNFAHYVPVDFSGHELCTTTPWIQGLQASAPYHPTTAGQRAYA
ncbi:MAG TPA: SGNH/GDSL hydrolase family protein, partial [Candidatus Saccharimonadales bacterium]|nr:SGNH/GDSL hydrolase family protein [Candidatus Saccharimonadales bacterium]